MLSIMMDSAMLVDVGPVWKAPMLPGLGSGMTDAWVPELVLAAILVAAV